MRVQYNGRMIVAAKRMVLAALFLCAAAAAQGAVDPALEARERALQERIIGACCWSETIAHHRSETALEQKVELRRLLAEGRTDEEITVWFKQKYGARVLVEPEGGLSVTAYALPAAAGLLGLAIVVWIIRRWSLVGAKPA